MIEIIPNWHPVFVHFTVALLSVSVLLFWAVRFMPDGKLRDQWRGVAQWNLWLGALITVFTVIAGVIAYNTVAHDTPSHEAMTEHRNWALVTASVFIVLAVWSWRRTQGGQEANSLMLVMLLVGGGLLASTAWHGGEAVYRYGLGVMSLPKTDAHDHAGGHHDDKLDASPATGHVESMKKEYDVENCELPEKDMQEKLQTEEKLDGLTEHHHDNHEGHPH